jgi:DNA-binding NarL/FixJ family response regulator
MTAVLVVEDQQVLASALEIAIDAQPDLNCVGTAGSVDDALLLMAAARPDVVLMDIELPGADGIAGTRMIKTTYPAARVLILTAGATPGRLAEAAAAGAGGFLGKDSVLSDILAAIRNPATGNMLIKGAMLGELLRERSATGEGQPPGDRSPPEADRASGPGGARLTAREEEVLALMGEGLDPSAIAERLVVSVYTARGHVKNVMAKLGAHTQLETVVLATRAGLLQPGTQGR